MTRGDSVGNQRTTAPWSHKCWAVPKNDHPRWYGIWLLIPGQDSQFLKCQEKNMFLFHLLLGKTGSWNYGTSLSRILDLELSPSFFAWYHIMVRYWFVVSQLIIFKNSAHNGNFAHYQSVKKKKSNREVSGKQNLPWIHSKKFGNLLNFHHIRTLQPPVLAKHFLSLEVVVVCRIWG